MPLYKYPRAYYLVLAVAAIALVLPAFINGFPLVNSDTASYISSGFKPETPFDRPITYGLLLRIFSLNGLSLWLVIFVQAYIVAWLVALVTRTLLNEKAAYYYPVIVFVLAIGSSLSWICSELIADVYTPIIFLCVFLLLYGAEPKLNRILLYVLFTVAVATHISHLLITVALLAVTFLALPLLTEKDRIRKTRISVLVMLILSLATISLMGAALSKSKHIFLMGSLLEKGVLQQYLAEKCPEKNYTICRYELPDDPNQFLWEEDSPLFKAGGWKATKEEYNAITGDILGTPKYLSAFAFQSAKSTGKQLITFHVGDGNTPFPQGSNVHEDIRTYLPRHEASFLNARQNKNTLLNQLPLFNKIIDIVLVLSILVVVIMLWLKKKNKALLLFVVVCFTGILINVIDCATFAQVNGRYGCRVMWLVVLAGMATVKKNTALILKKT